MSPVKKSEAKKSNLSDSISDLESSPNEENDHLKIFEQAMSQRFGIQRIGSAKSNVSTLGRNDKHRTTEALSKSSKSRSQI